MQEDKHDRQSYGWTLCMINKDKDLALNKREIHKYVFRGSKLKMTNKCDKEKLDRVER